MKHRSENTLYLINITARVVATLLIVILGVHQVSPEWEIEEYKEYTEAVIYSQQSIEKIASPNTNWEQIPLKLSLIHI